MQNFNNPFEKLESAVATAKTKQGNFNANSISGMADMALDTVEIMKKITQAYTGLMVDLNRDCISATGHGAGLEEKDFKECVMADLEEKFTFEIEKSASEATFLEAAE